MTWNPKRYEDDDDPNASNADQLRLPDSEQNNREEDPLRRVMTRQVANEGSDQLYAKLRRRIRGIFTPTVNPATAMAWVPLDNSKKRIGQTHVDWPPPPVFQTEPHSSFQFTMPNNVHLIPSQKIIYNSVTPKLMTKEWLEEVRESVDSVYRWVTEPILPDIPLDYDPEDPAFPWTQKLSNKPKTWEIELFQQRLASDMCYGELNDLDNIVVVMRTVPYVTKSNRLLRAVNDGIWPASPYSYHPYPQGPPAPEHYAPETTVDVADSCNLINERPTVINRVGLFWVFQLVYHQATAEFGHQIGPTAYSTIHYTEWFDAQKLGLSVYGPIGYDGICYMTDGVTPANGEIFIDLKEEWTRSGVPILNNKNEIVFDDAHNTHMDRVSVCRFLICQQHPKYPNILIKTGREQTAPTNGIQPWWSYFPDFAKEYWPYDPNEGNG